MTWEGRGKTWREGVGKKNTMAWEGRERAKQNGTWKKWAGGDSGEGGGVVLQQWSSCALRGPALRPALLAWTRYC